MPTTSVRTLWAERLAASTGVRSLGAAAAEAQLGVDGITLSGRFEGKTQDNTLRIQMASVAGFKASRRTFVSRGLGHDLVRIKGTDFTDKETGSEGSDVIATLDGSDTVAGGARARVGKLVAIRSREPPVAEVDFLLV